MTTGLGRRRAAALRQAALFFAAGLCLVTASLGCAPIRPASAPPRHISVLREHPRVVLTRPAAAPASREAWVRRALPTALATLQSANLAVRQRSELRLHTTVRSFVLDTGQSAPWLRAWTTFTTVHLLTPDYWRDHSLEAKQERLTHELCHLAIYQRFPSNEAAREANIPNWFLEGSCSALAGQGKRRVPFDVLRARLRGADPLRAPPHSHHLAYAAAHHAVAALIAARGLGVIAQIINGVALGHPFSRALQDATSLKPQEIWPWVISTAE